VVVQDLSAEAARWELKVLTGQKNLVQLKDQLAQQLQQWTALKALRANLISEVDERRTEARHGDAGLRGAQGGHREAARRISRRSTNKPRRCASAKKADAGRQTRSGRSRAKANRQYLTGLRMGGKRVVILVDTSTSMLDRTIVNIIRRRNMSPEQQRQAPKWKQLVNTVDWITTQIEQGTQVQIFGFNRQGGLAAARQQRQVGDAHGRQGGRRGRHALRAQYPKRAHEPACRVRGGAGDGSQTRQRLSADDGLPTMGEVVPIRAGVTAGERLDHFNRAVRQLARTACP